MWWVNNLKPRNGMFLVNKKPQIVIASNASLKGWAESSLRVKREGGLVKIGSKRVYKHIGIEGSKICVRDLYKDVSNSKNKWTSITVELPGTLNLGIDQLPKSNQANGN